MYIYFCATLKITHSLTHFISFRSSIRSSAYTHTHNICQCLARTAMLSIKNICRVYSFQCFILVVGVCVCVCVHTFFRVNLTIFQKSKYAATVFYAHIHIHKTPSAYAYMRTPHAHYAASQFLSISCITHACTYIYVHILS